MGGRLTIRAALAPTEAERGLALRPFTYCGSVQWTRGRQDMTQERKFCARLEEDSSIKQGQGPVVKTSKGLGGLVGNFDFY